MCVTHGNLRAAHVEVLGTQPHGLHPVLRGGHGEGEGEVLNFPSGFENRQQLFRLAFRAPV